MFYNAAAVVADKAKHADNLDPDSLAIFRDIQDGFLGMDKVQNGHGDKLATDMER